MQMQFTEKKTHMYEQQKKKILNIEIDRCENEHISKTEKRITRKVKRRNSKN